MDEVEPDDHAFLLRPSEAALDDPTRLFQGLESALSDPSEFAQKLEAEIETLGSKLGRPSRGDALLVINYLDCSLAELENKKGLAQNDWLQPAQIMAFSRKMAIRMGSTWQRREVVMASQVSAIDRY